jgi:thymidylate synthase (FAD)
MDPAQQHHLLNAKELKEDLLPQIQGKTLLCTGNIDLREFYDHKPQEPIMNSLRWKKYYPLSDKNAFICLVDHMGDDSSIVQAARVSYGKDKREEAIDNPPQPIGQVSKSDRQLIRYLMNHSHSTPCEMVEIKFMIQVPMDCWRQWIRHRTASVNEYSTRYTEALDMQQTTLPGEWRLQATDNKQGSSGFLEEWPEGTSPPKYCEHPGDFLSELEKNFHEHARGLYEERLALGIAKEQARKDLPLSTYTRAYWKCDLHNIFNFLRLRMDSHAQLEIRQFANCMFEIVKQICPVACEAFEDYVLYAKRFSRMEMGFLHNLAKEYNPQFVKPNDMTDREWKEFLKKLS